MAIISFASEGVSFYYVDATPEGPQLTRNFVISNVSETGFDLSYVFDSDCISYVSVLLSSDIAPNAFQVESGVVVGSLFNGSELNVLERQSYTFNVNISGQSGQTVTFYLTARSFEGVLQQSLVSSDVELLTIDDNLQFSGFASLVTDSIGLNGLLV